MAIYAQRSLILYFLISFCLLTADVFAGGGKDPDLSKADNLIKEKKYDEAVLVLTDYSRKNPDKFELAQKRLRKIYQIRDEFNRSADDLIKTLLNDPDNSEKILALSLKLNSLESEASPLLESFVSRTQEIAQFNVDRKQFREILERGRSLLDRGEYQQAITVYAGGVRFMREQFFAAGYGEAIENSVRRDTERLNRVIESFSSSSAGVGPVANDLVRALNAGNITEASQVISRLVPVMDRFIEVKRELHAAGNTFDAILEKIREDDPDIGDRNHLSFLSRVIYGRTGEDIQEGIAGAFELYWKNSIGLALNAITQNAQRANSQGLAAYGAGEYANIAAALNRAEQYINLSPLLLEKQRLFKNSERRQVVLMFNESVLDDDIPTYTNLRAIREAGNAVRQAAVFAQQVDTYANVERTSLSRWQAGLISVDAALNDEQQTRNTLTTARNNIERIIAGARQTDAIISAYNNTAYIKEALTLIEKTRSAVTALELGSADRYYTIANNYLNRGVTGRKEDMERGKSFLDGRKRENTSGAEIIDHYPAEALETLNAMLSAVSSDLQRANGLLERYRNEPPEIIGNEKIKSAQTSSAAVISELNNLRAQGLALSETARSRTALAQTYRQEGERLLREAQSAYQTQRFDIARDRLQRASERFTNSLEIQESSSLRQSWDTQMINLGRTINTAENEMIITEVRNLVNNARITYFAGNFQQAEDSLVRARNRWRITNAEENEEVIYWLGIVRGAMSARSGRVIPATAPLYPEMSQLLNEARKSYEEGVRFINAGNRNSGIAKFQEARRMTQEVRLMFPVNQEAGILELRMEQFTDPAAFNASFEQRLRTAVAGTKQRSMESFADLQNLAEINPRYPQIRAIITQAEIDMGLRPPPPNPRDLARSRELTVSASRILEENITAMYQVALTQINEAISLNPENAEAMRVKDRLHSRMSVPGAIVLSSEDENEYQRAVREFQAGNNIIALALVERLMQNPRNRNITKLVELQRRIQQVVL